MVVTGYIRRVSHISFQRSHQADGACLFWGFHVSIYIKCEEIMKLVLYESVREVANGQDGARIINVVENPLPRYIKFLYNDGKCIGQIS